MKNLAKELGSWSKDEPRIQAEVRREKEIFSRFVNKKVTIKVKQLVDLFAKRRYKRGRILKSTEHGFVFLEKGRQHRGKRITLGMYDGFFATLTVDEIKKGWSQNNEGVLATQRELKRLLR